MRGAAIGLAAVLGMAATAQAQTQTPLERGTYLMKSIAACGNCHTPPGGPMAGQEFVGGFEIPEDAFIARAPNITPDPETGIGRWTDEQIITAIREGKRPDGSIIGPPMPIMFYRGLSDDDVKAMVAYIRQVKPVRNVVAKSEYRIPLPPSYGPPVGSVAAVSKADPVQYGAYLAGPVGHCLECHTTMEKGKHLLDTHLGAGGMAFNGPWGVSVAANITPHPETGLGRWTDAEITRAVKEGVSKDGTRLRPPMAFAYYANIAADDMAALIAYLRSMKPVENKLK